VNVAVLPGGGLSIYVDDYAHAELSPEDARRLRDWLNEALAPTKADRVRACVQDFHDELAALQGCVCARPDDADEPESDEHARGYIDGYRDAREDADALDCDCDRDEPDVDMIELRMWAAEQVGGHDIPRAAELVRYVLGLPAA
jgi:hypothetical protein